MNIKVIGGVPYDKVYVGGLETKFVECYVAENELYETSLSVRQPTKPIKRPVKYFNLKFSPYNVEWAEALKYLLDDSLYYETVVVEVYAGGGCWYKYDVNKSNFTFKEEGDSCSVLMEGEV